MKIVLMCLFSFFIGMNQQLICAAQDGRVAPAGSQAVEESTSEIMARPVVVPNPPRQANPVRKRSGRKQQPAPQPTIQEQLFQAEAERVRRKYEKARSENDQTLMAELSNKLRALGYEAPE